jgi:HEPN domain-containing protein
MKKLTVLQISKMADDAIMDNIKKYDVHDENGHYIKTKDNYYNNGQSSPNRYVAKSEKEMLIKFAEKILAFK